MKAITNMPTMKNKTTNLGKTKAEIIFELIRTMNIGDSGAAHSRVSEAIDQYEELKRRGVIWD